MRKFLKTALALSAAILASSCGGGGLGGAEGSLDAKTLSAVLTSLPFTTILTGMKFDGGAVTAPVSLPAGVGFAAFVDQYSSCSVKEGSSADADGDGIAKNLTVTYNCPSLNANPGTYSRVGTYSETDFNDNKSSILGGFEFAFDFYSIYDAPHEYNEGSWKGSWAAKVEGKSIKMTHAYSIVNKNIQRTGGGSHEPTDFTWQSDWVQTYFPDDMAAPWDKGRITWAGYLKLLGQLVANNQPYNVYVVYEIDTNVTYDRVGCAGSYFKDGYIKFIDAGGNVVKYQYTNCTQSRTINGATL